MSTTTAEVVSAQDTRSWASRIGDFLIRHIMIVVMLLIVAFFAYRSARFATPDNLLTILIAAAPFALIALGQTLVILTGGIDLSVGSVIAASAMAGAWSAKNIGDNPIYPLIAAVVAGLLAGCINGLVVSRLNVPPFIATLGMLTLASGIAYVIGNGAPINGLPASYGMWANTGIGGFTIPVILMIVAIIAFAFIMRRTSYGLRVYAIGGNRLAAEIAGVRSRGILFSVYAISGLLAGLSGLMLSSRVITGAPNLGQGYELDAIAAVVIGGASLMGGRGTIWGTAIGLLLIQTINNGLDLLLVPAYWQNVIKGEPGPDVTPDTTLDAVDAAGFDALVIPGGTLNADALRVNETARQLTRSFAAEGKLIAAVCHGPWLLAETELSVGKNLTSYSSIRTDLVNAGATWVDEEVVVDGTDGFTLITSRTPFDMPAFTDAIVHAVS